MMNNSNKRIIMNGVASAVVGYGLTYYYLGENAQVNYFGMNISSPLAVGAGVGSGSVISDLTSDYVIKQLKINNQLMNTSTMAVKVAVSAGASAGVLIFGGLPKENVVNALLIGSASKLGGDYVAEKLFSPTEGLIGMIF